MTLPRVEPTDAYLLGLLPRGSGGILALRSARRSDEIAIPCLFAAALTVYPRSTRRMARETACD